MLDLSIASPPTKAGKCFTIQHHPYKLNELCVNNIPYNYNESQVLQIFNKYKSIKIISFINQIKTLHNRPCKIAVIQTSSGYVASQILQEMNNHEIYSYGRNKHVLSIRYNRIHVILIQEDADKNVYLNKKIEVEKKMDIETFTITIN
eukprot:455930_1